MKAWTISHGLIDHHVANAYCRIDEERNDDVMSVKIPIVFPNVGLLKRPVVVRQECPENYYTQNMRANIEFLGAGYAQAQPEPDCTHE